MSARTDNLLSDFMSLRHEDVPSLVYQPQPSEKPRSLRLNDLGMIHTFITYGRQLMQVNGGVLSLINGMPLRVRSLMSSASEAQHPSLLCQSPRNQDQLLNKLIQFRTSRRVSSAMPHCIPSSRTRTNGPTGTMPLFLKHVPMMFRTVSYTHLTLPTIYSV